MVRTIALSAFLTLVAFVSARAADACSVVPICRVRTAPETFTYGSGKPVPANAPALYIAQGYPPKTPSAAVEPPTLSMGTTTIMLEPQDDLHRLTAEPTPGTWSLRYWNACYGAMTEASVTFAPTAPMPTELEVTASAPQSETIVVRDFGGGCTMKVEATVVQLTVAASSALAPWAPLVRYTTFVDGAEWASSPYGSLRDVPANMYVAGFPDFDRIYTVCKAPYDGGTQRRGLPPGSHVIEVRAQIAGGVEVKSAPMNITLTCGATATDAGAPGTDGGSASDADAPSADTEPLADAQPPRASGCALGHTATSGSSLVLAALASLTLRRRVRGRRAARTRDEVALPAIRWRGTR